MAGFYGTFSKDNKSSIPDMRYFVNDEMNSSTNVVEKEYFHFVQYKFRDGSNKCGVDLTGNIIGGYAGYIENINGLCFTHLKGKKFVESTTLAELYRELGDKLWKKLNGNFVAVVYDSIKQEISLVSDRLSTFPLYYTFNSDEIRFSTSMLGLASVQKRSPELDLQATAEYLLFGYALDEHTLIRDIHMIEDASIVKYKGGQCSVKKYWVPDFTKDRKIKDENEITEGLNVAIDKALNRYCDNGNIGLAMSGGLDSRNIAARIPDKIKLAVVNGDPCSSDVKGAIKVCKQLNIPLKISYYDVNEFANNYVDAIIANDGIINTPEHLTVSRLLSKECNVGIVGAYGNGIRGHIGPDLIWEYKDLQAAKKGLCNGANKEYIKFSEAEYAFGSKINIDQIKYASDTFMMPFDKINTKDPYEASLWQDIYNRNRRRISPLLGVGRRCLEIRFPYTDNDLVEFALSIPWKTKVRNDIYRLGFVKRFPELAKIQNQFGQNYFYEARYDWLRQIRRKVYYASPNIIKYFSKPILPIHPNPANRDVYHTALKEETQRCLISLSEYGILKKPFVDKILKEQLSGYNNRYTLMHKLVTLTCLIDGIGIWKRMQIS